MQLKTRERWKTAGGLTAAFFLPLYVWGMVLYAFGVYPFGDSSILITDLSSQYVEYHAAIYDMVKSGSSLFFTWDSGLGMNFWGLFAYYLSSPFTLLMFLFPRTMITEAVLLIISIKMAASGLTFSLFLRKGMQINGAVNLLASVMYALCGYAVSYCFNLMFLDGLVFLPLAALATRHLLNKNKMFPLIAVLTFLFIANYYVSYMTGVFLFLLFIVWLVQKRESRSEFLRHIGRFVGSAAAAAGLAAFLLLPAFFSLTEGYEKLHGFSLTFSGLANPLSIPAKLAYGAFDSVTNNGSPNVFCGLLTVGLLPVWFTHRSISRREKLATGGLLLFLLLSMCLYDLDVAWHVFQPPTWFPFRYSFVFIFLLILCAARVLSDPDGVPLWGLFGGFMGMATLFAILSISGFPFTGNRLVTIFLLLGYLAVLVVALLVKKPLVRRFLMLLLVVVVSGEMVGNALHTLTGLNKELGFVKRAAYTNYRKNSDERMAVLETLGDPGFFRVENAMARDSNDGLAAGYHAVSHYSSVSNQKTFHYLGDLGMVNYVNHRYLRYYGASSLLDAVLGVKYVWSPQDRRYGMEKLDFEAVGGTYLYENTMALPLLFAADEKALEITEEANKPFVNQNRLFSGLSGIAEDCLLPLEHQVSSNAGVIKNVNGRTELENVSYLYITIQNPRRQHLMLYLQNNFSAFSSVTVEGKRLNHDRDRLVEGAISLGEQPAGEIRVSIGIFRDSAWFNHLQVVGLDETVFNRILDKLQAGVPSSLEVGDDSLSAVITMKEDGVLFTSLPVDPGWSVWLDGKKTAFETVNDAFIAIPAKAGEHKLEMRFCPKGFVPGLTLSILTLVGLLAAAVWRYQRQKRKQAAVIPSENGGTTVDTTPFY